LGLFAYNRAATRSHTWNARLGLLVAILTAVVGTSVFATLQEDVSLSARISVGLISLLATVLAGVQVYAKLPEAITEYEKAARRFGAVRREIEEARLRLSSLNEDEVLVLVATLRGRLDQVAEESPNAPGRLWERTRRHVKGEYTWWERLGVRLRGLPPPRALQSVEVNVRAP
jgi:hypothetical protein